MKVQSKEIMIPREGIPVEELFSKIQERKKADVNWKEGKVWSLVYHVDDNHLENIKEAYNQYFSESYVNPFAFQSAQQMEKEVIRMTANLLHGSTSAVGTMTSGGTESIFLSVYTHRERAKSKKPGLKTPEIILPASAHPAFVKAAHILGLKVRKIGLDLQFRADPVAIEKAINANTILVVVSAPSYPHGILDPVEAVAAIAQKHRKPLHVDSCIGGFMLPWVEQLGYPVSKWDFRIPGVSSISADVHKFGYGSKGASVLLFRDMDFLKHQFFITTDWPGGIYASSTFLGSRSCGPIAAAWTAMNSLGQEGYLKITRQIMVGVQQLQTGLAAIPEIQLVGKPVMNILAYNTENNRPDIFVIADQMEKKGWSIDRQQKPNCIHMTIMPQHIPIIVQYLDDLYDAVDYARRHPKESAKGNAAIYGLMARIPFRGMVRDNVRNVFINMYKVEDIDTDQSREQDTGPDDPFPESSTLDGSTQSFSQLVGEVKGKGLA